MSYIKTLDGHKIMDTEAREQIDIILGQMPVSLTQEEYDALVEAGTVDPNVPYLIY